MEHALDLLAAALIACRDAEHDPAPE